MTKYWQLLTQYVYKTQIKVLVTPLREARLTKILQSTKAGRL